MNTVNTNDAAMRHADAAIGRIYLLIGHAFARYDELSDETPRVIGDAAIHAMVLVGKRRHQVSVAIEGLSRMTVIDSILLAQQEAHSVDDGLRTIYPEITYIRVLLDEAQHYLRNSRP